LPPHLTEQKARRRLPPLISVIVPAYNAEATLLETIDSVRHQTLTDFELIVIDDGSTDQTAARVRSVRDARARIITCTNRGLAASRNRGIEWSTGQYISFIDADDMWTPDKLEHQLDALRRRPDAALAYSWTAFVDEDGRFLFAKEPSRFEGDVYADLLRYSNFVASGSNILVRRDCAIAVGGFDATLEAAHDWDFCLRIAARWPFAVVPRYQIFYRISESAMSANAVRAEQNCLRLCEKAFGQSGRLSSQARSQSLSNVKQYAAFLYLSRTTGIDFRRGAGRKLAESIQLYPRTLLTRKTWSLLLTWSLLAALPSRRRRRAVMTLLRAYGRWLWLWRRDIRQLAAFSGGLKLSHKKGTAMESDSGASVIEARRSDPSHSP
jgi:glycosyltransferase involved in cell wall biosynthesis